MKIYLSGPMSGLPDFGYPIFNNHATRLRNDGHEVINPADNFDGRTDHPAGRPAYMRLDIQHVLDSEAVAVLPGWESSAGARLEVSVARELGLAILDVETMKPVRSGDPRFHALLAELAMLHDRKQQDYGAGDDPLANVRASEDWGIPAWVGACVRLNDKVKRLQSFARKGYLANEGAEDSLQDIAVYALLALILMREKKQ